MERVSTQAQPLDLAEARALAARENLQERVVAYVTRTREELELLVLAHTPEYPDAGIQVPAGSLEPGETLEEAALREVWEETGLRLSSASYLQSFQMTRAEQHQIWHFFWLTAPQDTPDHWEHIVTGGVADKDMKFLCSFVPLEKHGLIPGHQLEAGFSMLSFYVLR